jgi:hypothetical protein
MGLNQREGLRDLPLYVDVGFPIRGIEQHTQLVEHRRQLHRLILVRSRRWQL